MSNSKKNETIGEIDGLLKSLPLEELLKIKSTLAESEKRADPEVKIVGENLDPHAKKTAYDPVGIIDLSDDADGEEVLEAVQKKRKIMRDCVNPLCPRTSSDFFKAPYFLLSHFYIKKKPKKQQSVCSECLDKAIEEVEIIVGQANDGVPVYEIKIPRKADVVEIEDSDSDDGEVGEDKDDLLSQQDLMLLNSEFYSILDEVIARINPKNQLDLARKYFHDRIEAQAAEIEAVQKDLNELEKNSYKIYTELYACNKVKIKHCQPLNLVQKIYPSGRPYQLIDVQEKDPAEYQFPVSSKPQKQIQTSQQKAVLEKSSSLFEVPAAQKPIVQKEPLKLQSSYQNPAVQNQSIQKQTPKPQKLIQPTRQKSVLEKPSEPQVSLQTPVVQKPIIQKEPPKLPEKSKNHSVPSNVYFAVRTRPLDKWAPCELLEKTGNCYTVRFLMKKKNHPDVKTLSGKELAASTRPMLPLNVGSRVIANFNENKKSKNFIAGVIGEKKSPSNEERYLVFADDGKVAYKDSDDVRQVMEQSNNVCEDVHDNLKSFLMDYLKICESQRKA